MDHEVTLCADRLADLLGRAGSLQLDGVARALAGRLAEAIERAQAGGYGARVAAACAAAVAVALVEHARDAEAAATERVDVAAVAPLTEKMQRLQTAVIGLRDQVLAIESSFSQLPRPSRPDDEAFTVPADPIAAAAREAVGVLGSVAGHQLRGTPDLDGLHALADLIANAHEAADEHAKNGWGVVQQVSLAAAAAVVLAAYCQASRVS